MAGSERSYDSPSPTEESDWRRHSLSDGKYAPRIDGTKQEKTGGRASDYSLWHRTLGSDFLTVDIDFVEYRKDRGIVALIDVTGEMNDEAHMNNSKRFIWARTGLQFKVLSLMSVKLGVPAYFVLHDRGLTIFHVYDLAKGLDDFRRLTQAEYAAFLRQL